MQRPVRPDAAFLSVLDGSQIASRLSGAVGGLSAVSRARSTMLLPFFPSSSPASLNGGADTVHPRPAYPPRDR